ncbi:MAG TPA: hypothetical protein VNX21_05015 [Candidatus Thermoplasmatota archaeon]|nr:hypothetical protein [Candidatus Thermoplasmatota archaeon]
MAHRFALLLTLCVLLPLASSATDPHPVVWVGDNGGGNGELACVTTPGGPTACAHQVDGGQSGDASNSCADPSPPVVKGTTFQGWTAPPADAEDDYAMSVSSGATVIVNVLSHLANPPVTTPAAHAVDVWAPSGSSLCAAWMGVARPGEPLTFTAPTGGTYTLQVRAYRVPDPTAGLPGGSSFVRSCHLMCALTNVTGYTISTGG